jgi:serine/threonine protein kinase
MLGPCFVRRLRRIATHLVSALSVLRTEGVIHADIKPENIFLDYPPCPSSSPAALTDLPGTHCDPLSALPCDDFNVRIGDFGNAFHKTEVSRFYDDFSIQSLPYRSPEVLMGVPFGDKVDVWSVGIVLLELCLGRTLFFAKTREELFLALCATFSAPPSALLFAGGRYTSDLLAAKEDAAVAAAPTTPAERKPQFNDHVAGLYALLSSPPGTEAPEGEGGVDVRHLPGSLLHFIAGLTHWDPDQRLSAQEALQHDFITCALPIPVAALGGRSKQKDRIHKSISLLRMATSASSAPSPRNASGSKVSHDGGLVGKRKMGEHTDTSRAEHKHSR